MTCGLPQGGTGTELEPETETLRTVFVPELKPEAEWCPCVEAQGKPAPGGTVHGRAPRYRTKGCLHYSEG